MTQVQLLPIRHHGPGSARSVHEALELLQPDLVLVEGPPELDEIIGLLAHPELTPPVAGLVYAPDEPRRAGFYPLAGFSPEWVALRWALSHTVRVGHLDLPATHTAAIDQAIEQGRQQLAEAALAEKVGESDTEPDAVAEDESFDGDSPAAQPVVPDDPIAALAAAAGYDDPERWWEDAVEQRTDSVLERFAAITEAIGTLRADLAPVTTISTPDGELDLAALAPRLGEPMTALREAAMRRVLRAAIKDGHETIAVICGAWHAPALLPDQFPAAAADNRLLRGLPKTKVAAAWVPWTASRLSQASGYGAGVSSPGWYAHLFDHWMRGTTNQDEIATSWLVRVARELRDQGIDASTASVVEAARLALSLAAVRGRPSAGLSELDDAALSILADGNPLPLHLVHDRLVVGEDLGAVPDEAPLVPLAADLAKAQRSTRLKPQALAQQITLDLRTDGGMARSVLLHRLRLLGIDWGRPTDTGRTTGTFKEGWELTWQPELAIAVVEASLYGTTIESAAAAKVAELAAEAPTLGTLSALVDACLLAELPVHQVVAVLAERTAVATDVPELLEAIEPLARVARYGTVRGVATNEVGQILQTTAVRACVGLPMAGAGLDTEAAVRLRRAMESAHNGLTLLEDSALLDQWLTALAVIADRDQVPGVVVGRATRMVLDSGKLDRDQVGIRMGRWLSPVNDPVDAAGWLDGFLAGDALLLVHDPTLLAMVDGWLSAVGTDSFDDLLPLLRRTFSEFTRPERRMIGEQVSRGVRTHTVAEGPSLNLDRAVPGLRAVAALLGWEVTP